MLVLTIVAIGDLFQLQPAMDGYIFKDMDNDEYGILAPNIWQEFFRMFELHQIMRQRESRHFAEMLNRLREGNHNKDDIRLINHNTFTSPEDAPHLFIQNARVNDFNIQKHIML